MKKTLMLLMLAMISVGAWAQKITSVSGITSGHKYYIGATTDGTDYYFSTDCSATSNSVEGKAVTEKSKATVIQFIKDNNSGRWNLKFDGTDYYLSLGTAYDDKGKVQVVTSPADFNIDAAGSLLQISKGNSLQLNTNNKTQFGSFSGGSTNTINVWLEEVPTTATITLNSACTDGSKVYGTYSNASAWVVPAALTVSEIGVNNDILNVKSYSTGAVVPANTGVMVSAEKWNEGTKDFTVNLSDEAGTSVLGSANCLRPTGDAGITAEQMATADANCTYYRLTMHNGTQIGFWWGAAEGAAFALGANKAYLAVHDDQQARTGLWFGDNEEALEAIEMKATTTIYTLDGMKVNELQKGLNIVSGKKVMVK